MIGYFPTPFENESLYSLVARYHKETKNGTPKDKYLELFDRKEITLEKICSIMLKV